MSNKKKPSLDSKCPISILEAMCSKQKEGGGHPPESLRFFDKDQSHDFYMGMMVACRVFSENVQAFPIQAVIAMMGGP